MKNFKGFFLILPLALLVAFGCTDANRSFVKKAVKIMDRSGLYATGEEFCDDPIEADVNTETPMEDSFIWFKSLK